MVHLLPCTQAHLPLPLFFPILLLLLIFSMEVAHSDARRLPLKLLEVGTIKEEPDETIGKKMEMEMEMEGRRLIGSRPPRCERVCMSCGHCEAVQVPIVPQVIQKTQTKAAAAAAEQEQHVVSATAISAAVFTYRVNGLSNYKPLSWKCKCGGIILDP
uniref:Epidermal patterning factor-like protein n=1 Tax=Oryza punctata TaxID=4537 RepID=A0A0E0LGT9_ORYPU